jgi:signal transduction histidine kinase
MRRPIAASPYSHTVTGWRDVRAWLHEHPVGSDGLLGLLLLVPALTLPADAPGGTVVLSGALKLLAVAACLALAVRRLWPVPVWLVTSVVAVIAVLVEHGPSGAVVLLFVALYTLGTRYPPRVSLAAGTLSGVALLLSQVSVSSARPAASTYAPATWCLLATVIGLAVRNQRRVVAEAHERARIAEESREEEARRRVDEERLRIARELHDVVAHHIAVINVQSGAAEHLLDTDPAAAQEAIGHVRAATGEVLAEMSTLLGLLRTGNDDDSREPARGLADLDGLVESFRRTGLRVTVRQEGELARLAPLVDVTAYRVLEEALTNASKHGTGGAADVVISQTGETTVLEVRNRVDGPVPDTADGHGLVGMRERVTAIGGVLNVGADGQGRYLVRAELPTVVPVGGAT